MLEGKSRMLEPRVKKKKKKKGGGKKTEMAKLNNRVIEQCQRTL